MSNMQFDTGTVAVATVDGQPNVRVMRVRWIHDGAYWAAAGDGERGLYEDDRVTDIRPLVVLDIADWTWLPNRLRFDGDSIGMETGRKMRDLADQIEQQIPPPKPEEPFSPYAVIEDRDGREWVRIDPAGYAWQLLGMPGAESRYATWDEIDAVKVLRS